MSDIAKPNKSEQLSSKPFRTGFRNRVIWIIAVTFVVYLVLDAFINVFVFSPLMFGFVNWSHAMKFVLDMYTGTFSSVIVLFLLCVIFKKNRFIWRTFLPARRRLHDADPEDSPEARTALSETGLHIPDTRRFNTFRNLGTGLLLGFLTNIVCILCALIHGDIKLYFELPPKMIPIMIFAFISVFIQSASEEVWCRGFMYERIRVHYPLWVAIVVNGVVFGLLHLFNDGVTVLAIVNIIICGLSFSLLRWYTGSMWTVMGIHAAWNFTQNFIFGLPNSGLVSEVSAFHLDAANGISNLVYSYEFGVEGALPAFLVDLILGIAILILAKRNGRLRELSLSYEKMSGVR